jgi:aryl-alcohol dehydrogenase-like predicted oxidoreductase
VKIALGTAQLGLEYGITNTLGRVSPQEAARILDVAERAGVRLLDTAPAYGDSEEVLGSLRAAERFAIVTKTARLGAKGPEGVVASFERSLERLGATSLDALFVHAAADLGGATGRDLAARLRCLQEQGRVRRIGVSVYSAAEVVRALAVLDVDAVQVPVNVLDQRLLGDGTLGRLKKRGIEIHARSAFLQGVLVTDPASLPAYFDPIRPRLDAWRSFCRERGLTPLRAALGFVCGIAAIDQVVCGVESARQLEEVLAAAEPLDPAEFRQLALDDPDFVDPSRWRISV